MANPKSEAPASSPNPSSEAKQSRKRLSQEAVPTYSLDQALRVPRAIGENYAFKPTRPLNVAEAMGMSPTSGPFRAITGSAVAYGLTTAAAQAPEIGLTPLGLRVIRPTVEGDDLSARREALLKPTVIGDFLRNYDGAALPADTIAKNVLMGMGVPADRLDGVLELISDGARAVGFIREFGGKRYVDLAAAAASADGAATAPTDEPAPRADRADFERSLPQAAPAPATAVSVGPGININIEIHIAADASAATIEEIFRNMRRYVLSSDGRSNDGTASAD
jgi:hypothetical protein